MVVQAEDMVAQLSRAFQIGAYALILWRCQEIIARMPHVRGWHFIWAFFVIGFVTLLARPAVAMVSRWLDLDDDWTAWLLMSVAPLVTCVSFLIAVESLYWWLEKTPDAHPEFYIPPAAHIAINAESTILAWDIEAERLFGWLASEAIGASLLDRVIPQWLHQTHLNAITAFLLKGADATLKPSYPTTARNRAGVEFPVEITLKATQGEAGMVFESEIRRMRY